MLSVHANSFLPLCKFLFASMQIPLCVHANSVVHPCKLLGASMQIPSCIPVNKWKQTTKENIRMTIFDQFWAKIYKSETNVLFNFSLRNLFFYWSIELSTFLNGHRKLETESTQVANFMKIRSQQISLKDIHKDFGMNFMFTPMK